ncbi:MAG: TonB-dependent receptor [Bacteroidales bacterium]|nr:TonB-dependent receptor [Bacteroidales bacterium]
MNSRKLLVFNILFFLLSINININAQSKKTGTIRGFVYEKKTGEPVIFTNVYLKNTTYGCATDVNGYFAITKIPVGSYTLMVTSIGFDTLSMPVKIDEDLLISKKLFLTESAYMLKAVNISAEREEARTETKTSIIKITPKQIKRIPSIGGQPDLAQYLQVLPGVIFTGDQGGQLYIRGGSPIQNKVLLDGMIIYNPFHSIGLFSIFDTDILRNIDVYTGGYGAEYGGRISSIMNIKTRDGNKKRISGKTSLSTFGAKIMLEGPIIKQKEDKQGATSFIISMKNSYLDKSKDIFYKNIDQELPYKYTDIYGKLSFSGSKGNKISFFGFNFNDQANFNLSKFNWNSSGGGSNFIIIPESTPVFIEGNFAYSKYDITLNEKLIPERVSSISGFNGSFNFTYFIGKNSVKWGLEMLGLKTDYHFLNSANRLIQQKENTSEIGAFVKYKLSKGKFIFEPSFRLQWYASLSEMSPEPRLAIKYNLSDNFRLKFAGGFYSQNLISANSDRDVVNLFYGFLSGSDNLQKTFQGNDVNSKLQKAQHLILGMEYDITNNLNINIEGYYKNFSQLTNINRNKIFDDIADNYEIPDYQKKDFIIESGDAEGVDFSVKYEHLRANLWVVYSYAFVNREFEIENNNHEFETIKYSPVFDRRHNINVVGSYLLGKNMNWQLSVRWNFGTGFPFTQTQGYYEKIIFNSGLNTNYITTNGSLGIQYADINGGRLPTYHRMDINLTHTFELGEHTRLEANISVTNIYNRKNIFYVDRVTNKRVDQLPIMPSFGLNFSF